MASVPEELINFCRDSYFFNIHKSSTRGLPDNDWINAISKMLTSTMDDVRIYYAEMFAKHLLLLSDIDDASHFRNGMLKRERLGNIEYDKQRDHASHTVYNYILGHYFFSKNYRFREVFAKQIEQYASLDPRDDTVKAGKYFSHIWVWASLLHDIGYLMEGAIDILNSLGHSPNISHGAKIVASYFNERFWWETDLNSTEIRRILKGNFPHRVDSTSMASIAASIINLDSLEPLYENLKTPLLESLGVDHLPGDAFDLWRLRFRWSNQDKMVEIVESCKEAFNYLLWEELPGQNIRLLDHGVCSGAIMLAFSTYYFRIRTFLSNLTTADCEIVKTASGEFLKREQSLNAKYESEKWWVGVIWGTAAAGIHNILQIQDKLNNVLKKRIPPLDVQDDLMSYLGVLVDIIEEWDRYSVKRSRFLFHSSQKESDLPVQGINVDLKFQDEKVIINYNNTSIRDRVMESLDNSLQGWEDFIEVSG